MSYFFVELYDSGNLLFFSPKMNKLDDICLNHPVEFCIGFSYDGLRAVDLKLK